MFNNIYRKIREGAPPGSAHTNPAHLPNAKYRDNTMNVHHYAAPGLKTRPAVSIHGQGPWPNPVTP